MNTLIPDNRLIWLPEEGWGYFPVADDRAPYNADYFAKYQKYARTERGQAINDFRLDIVNRYTEGEVIDVGIGCGAFVSARNSQAMPTYGYDVNPEGIQWLCDRKLYRDPYQSEGADAITCWDALEHIADPTRLLRRVRRYVFATVPIFEGPEHVLRSKHYRQDEHYWYWTDEGFNRWMAGHGFTCLELSARETRLGREDIRTFAFARTNCG